MDIKKEGERKKEREREYNSYMQFNKRLNISCSKVEEEAENENKAETIFKKDTALEFSNTDIRH